MSMIYFPKNTWFRVLLSFSILLLLAIFALVLNRELKSRRMEQFLEESPARIVSQMSLQQKVGQLFHIGIVGKTLTKATKEIIRKYKVGGVILFAENLGTPQEITSLNTALQTSSVKHSDIPLFISTDQEGGRVKRLGPEATMEFPGAMALGQTANPLYAKEVGFVTGYELRKLGINWMLAPVLDINSNPKNPVINVRSFGSRPELVAQMGRAYIKGNRQALSLSAIKHFPGHGDTDIDSHLELPRINKSLAELETMELLPFRQAIQAGGAEVLMTAHILFPSLDAKRPATLSAKIIKQLLREKLGFNGVIMTDAMEMKAISRYYKPTQAAKLAFQASVDIILLTKGDNLGGMYQALLKGFRDQSLSVEQLETSVMRQLRLKLRRGLLSRWSSPYDKQTPDLQVHWDYLERVSQHQYNQIQDKYRKKGISLNTAIARDSIRSIRWPFFGIELKNFDRVHLLVHSQAMHDQALRMGIPSKRVHTLGRSQDILQVLRRSSDEIWLIELDAKSIKTWNRLLAKQQHRQSQRSSNNNEIATTIALYTGNPFLEIHLPQRGAILTSCSESPASRAALVYRALYPGKIIHIADVIESLL